MVYLYGPQYGFLGWVSFNGPDWVYLGLFGFVGPNKVVGMLVPSVTMVVRQKTVFDLNLWAVEAEARRVAFESKERE